MDTVKELSTSPPLPPSGDELQLQRVSDRVHNERGWGRVRPKRLRDKGREGQRQGGTEAWRGQLTGEERQRLRPSAAALL